MEENCCFGIVLCFILISCGLPETRHDPGLNKGSASRALDPVSPAAGKSHLDYLQEARDYAKLKKAREDYYLLFQLSKHSGLKRLLLIDLRSGLATDSFMVSHGAGRNPWGRDFSKDKPATSNTVDSHLSSEGRYLVGNRDYSSWGIHVKYWMYGQDPTNSNAVKRVVVLHSWDYTPDEEVYPDGTPESWGCPAVSDQAMRKLDTLLRRSDRPMLFWVIK
jgi:L,D-transpeptidase catalytic domain